MAKFLIEPHFRLQEWVAHEKDYFAKEGLDYEFRELMRSTDGKIHDKGSKGAYQSFEEGRKANVSCACHWTVNVAAPTATAKCTPTSIRWRRPASSSRPIRKVKNAGRSRRRADLGRLPVRQPLRHGAGAGAISKPEADEPQLCRRHAVQAHGAFCSTARAPAVNLFSGPYYFAEQLGFRKVIDTTFMIGTMIHGDPDPEDLRKFFRALRKAQRDIDLRPELYTHYYKNEFPDRFHARMDTRRWGPGERLVFEPYTKEVYEESFEWIAAHGIFPDGKMGSGRYEQATLSLG